MTVPVIAASQLSALYQIGDQLQLNTVRLRATALGRAHGLDPDTICRLGIVATELATNIARHAGTGQILIRPVGEPFTGCVELLALDKGPGIADMTRVMREDAPAADGTWPDGGLTGVRRLSDLFDIYSQTGRGTAVVVHFGMRDGPTSTCKCTESMMHGCVGAVCVPMHGEIECGDAWAVDMSPGRLTALLVDGLGHGPGAAAAALAATTTFSVALAQTPEMMLGSMHSAMRDTRGAALSVTTVTTGRKTARFCGVGNVDGRVVTADSNLHLIPQSGIVGLTMHRAQSTDVEWPAGARLVMHSDGISPKWRVDQYPGLLARHPALLAGVLFRDFGRARDDATVLVLREAAPTVQ